MRTGLLTIFAVAILAALTAGSPHASETSTLNADAAETADSRADAEPEPAAAGTGARAARRRSGGGRRGREPVDNGKHR